MSQLQPLLARKRLLQRISKALQKGDVFIAAPAGYGKSTLLRALIVEQPESYAFAITPADADLSVLQARLQATLSQAKLIVLDDVHHLTDANESLLWLAEQQRTSGLRWVMAGRAIPFQWAAAEHLTAEDLAFGLGETRALLGVQAESLAAEWCKWTQGWPLALALVARQSSQKLMADATTLSREALFAYLAERIFADLPSALAEFVRLSALPLRFSDALLAEVLDRPITEISALRHEVQRRNLFLEATEHAGNGDDNGGWFKYHDLVRQYLCDQVALDQRQSMAERLVTKFEDAGDWRLAIEHALDGQMFERVATLLNVGGTPILFDFGWIQSYKRWVDALPDSVQAASPLLLAKLGFGLVFHARLEREREAFGYLNRAKSLAVHHAQPEILAEVNINVAGAYIQIGRMEKALPILHEAIREPRLPVRMQVICWLRIGTANAFLYRLRNASHAYSMLPSLIERLESAKDRKNFQLSTRHNLAVLVAAVRGDFVQQETLLRQNLVAHQGELARIEITVTGLCTLHECLGDWDALVSDLQEIKRIRIQMESDAINAQGTYQLSTRWETFNWATVWAGRGDYMTAQQLTTTFIAKEIDPEAAVCGYWLQAWILRKQGKATECNTFAKGLAPDNSEGTQLYRGMLAFERAAATFFAGRADWLDGAQQHVRAHMRIGAKHYLLRWRVLLALGCHRAQNTAWRKHITFALDSLARYGYHRLLIQREPELAAHFWALCLAENIQPDTATSALIELGRIEPICNYLPTPTQTHHTPSSADATLRMISALASVGDEAAIPALMNLSQREQNKRVMAAIKIALDQLEALPPPKLVVTLLGDFGLQRGGVLVAESAWHRPGVRQLFQYFCLQHGRTLTREQILQEVWPEADAASALAAFRLNFSRMRSVLEPHLRSHTPMRYFAVVGDAYCFDPQRSLVTIDSEQFVRVVDAALKQPIALDEKQLAELLQKLTRWQPLLPELAYSAWAIHAIEHLNERYADGCLLAAQHLLALDRLADASIWAERVTSVAPWNEAGWQTLIRCTAQQGQRTAALRLYERAVAALQRELGMPPSTETQQLVQRLRRGEMI